MVTDAYEGMMMDGNMTPDYMDEAGYQNGNADYMRQYGR